MQQEFKANWDSLGAVISGLFNRVATLEEQVKSLGGTVTVATPQEQVVQVANEVAVTTPVVEAPANPMPGQPTGTTISAETELDDEGVPWDARIHASTKSKVNSTVVKGGKKWRLAKGVDKAVAEQVLNEIRQTPAETTAPVTEAVTAPAAPAVPGVPAATGVPAVPNVPGVPPATGAVDENAEIRNQSVAIIKQLTDDYGLDIEDCKEILSTEFGAAQNGDQVVFGSLKTEQYPQVLEYFTKLRDNYSAVQTAVQRIYELAGDAHKANVDQGVVQIYATVNTQELGGVHYSQIQAVLLSFQNWLQQWENMNNGA